MSASIVLTVPLRMGTAEGPALCNACFIPTASSWNLAMSVRRTTTASHMATRAKTDITMGTFVDDLINTIIIETYAVSAGEVRAAESAIRFAMNELDERGVLAIGIAQQPAKRDILVWMRSVAS